VSAAAAAQLGVNPATAFRMLEDFVTLVPGGDLQFQGSGIMTLGFGLWAWGLGFRVWSLCFWVWGLGFGTWDFGVRA